jgi:hypothetical protein
MNRLFFLFYLSVLPVLAWAQAVPPAMPAPTTNLPPPMPAPTTNLPPPMAAPTPLVVPTAPMYLNASQTFVSRGSTATYFDNTGTLQTVATNTPRYDYDPITHATKGILVEPRRTNYVQNSQFLGFTPGSYTTTTSLGTGNHWLLAHGSWPANLTMSIVNTGTENGISYVDIRTQINNTTGGIINTNFRTGWEDWITINPGMKTSFSGWLGVLSYSSTGGACRIVASNRSYTSTKQYLMETQKTLNSVTSFAPFEAPVLTHPTGARYADGWFYVHIPNGVNCDITFRVGAPQFEVGDTPTSYIPTSTGPVTRVQDVYQQF